MSRELVKFPSTPHLLWLGSAAPRADKVMGRPEAEEFLQGRVTIEEKVDGANLGISFDNSGELLAQNRGNFLERGIKGQFAPLWRWLAQRQSRLFDVLGNRAILFGEWCYARHSISYTSLPDYFLAFDVYDKLERRFVNTALRDRLVADLELHSAPRIDRGTFQLKDIPRLLGKSSLYDGLMEGVYFRREDTNWLTQRAKVVRPEFVQQISEHWSRQPLVPNTLCAMQRNS